MNRVSLVAISDVSDLTRMTLFDVEYMTYNPIYREIVTVSMNIVSREVLF